MQYLHRLNSLLDPEERQRAFQYKLEKDKQRFIVSRATLKYLSGRYLDLSPQDIVVGPGRNQKPFIQMTGIPDLHFNIAHSGDCILVAFADTALGVDIEQMDKKFNFQEILERSFNPAETSFIQNSERSYASFFLHWTRKEALLKAIAKGIDDDLVSIPCLDGEHEIDAAIINSSQSWIVRSFEVGEHCVGSIAHAASINTIRFWNLKISEILFFLFLHYSHSLL
jgi:4'-phosphopantetheinyl transferase